MPDQLTGRDLDAAVCGIMEARPEKHPMDYFPWRTYSDEKWWHAAGDILEPDDVRWEPRPVSTDISWAMRAYGVLHERGWWLDLQCRPPGEWACCLAKRPHFVDVVAPTPAEAICWAIVEAADAR
jgi:hypothetical protein